jgi:hypothetical protein
MIKRLKFKILFKSIVESQMPLIHKLIYFFSQKLTKEIKMTNKYIFKKSKQCKIKKFFQEPNFKIFSFKTPSPKHTLSLHHSKLAQTYASVHFDPVSSVI